ncbi:MAG: sterol desaturase family protein [Myxococcaceae bacterium]|nr:sterol desaturase family protein [Myxococcaceae bacterium]
MADVAMLAGVGLLLLYLVLDAVKPARRFVKVPWWRLKGLLFFVVMFALNGVLPAVAAEVLAPSSLLGMDRLPLAAQFLLGTIGMQFVVYWYHRAAHRSDVMWRWLHQMHHSAERMDIYGAAYFHPFEMLAQIVTGILVMGPVMGLSADGAGLVGAFAFMLATWQHANINTPAWVGYLVQRPEGHTVHHARGVHNHNFGDIALWDLVFGTFKNPKTIDAQAGFSDFASREVGAMLLGRDVSGGNLGQREGTASSPAAVRVASAA